MPHIISKYTTSATVLTSKLIATIDISGESSWEPYDGEKPVLLPRHTGYALCERTDVTVSGKLYKGFPENKEIFTIGKLVPIGEIPENSHPYLEDWKKHGTKYVIYWSPHSFGAYIKEKHGKVVKECTVMRQDS